MSGNHHEGLPRLFTNPPWMRHAPCVGKTEQFFGVRGNSTWARRAKDKYGDRRAVGIEQSERYCEIAAKRLAQGVLDFEVTP